jgi:L-alanine-DL-glutamate epimerase-like enolase superfamily enzyme
MCPGAAVLPIVLNTAHLTESFGVQCEIHSTVYLLLDLVNLHCCAAVQNCRFVEMLVPRQLFDFGLAQTIAIEEGLAKLPDAPGLTLDWGLIDDATFAILLL